MQMAHVSHGACARVEAEVVISKKNVVMPWTIHVYGSNVITKRVQGGVYKLFCLRGWCFSHHDCVNNGSTSGYHAKVS